MFGFLVTGERRLPGLIDAVRAGFDYSAEVAMTIAVTRFSAHAGLVPVTLRLRRNGSTGRLH